jgi:PAS domain S-box-containing protein
MRCKEQPMRALKRWLAFGLTPEQEERFRQARLGADVAQAWPCLLLALGPLLAFALSDYSYLGLSWRFYGLAALRLALWVHTLLLLKHLRSLTSFRSYDRAVFAWSLFVSIFALSVGATRPQTFVGHTGFAVVAVFLTVLAVPNRFANQLVACLVCTVGETLVLMPGLLTLQPDSVTAAVSLWLVNSIAVACGWHLHAWHRRDFLAREEEQQARAEAEKLLAERHRAEAALRQSEQDQRVMRALELQRWQLEQRVAERTAAFRQSEERFRAFFDLAAAGAAEADVATRRFVRVNDKLCEMTGYTREELLNMTFLECTHPDDRSAHAKLHERLLRGEIRDYTIEKRYVTKNGQVLWVEAAIGLVRDAAGKPVRVIGVILDITERKKLQVELEHLVAERTAKLQEMVGELQHFSYTITHDMRAPLRAMYGFASLMTKACAVCQEQEPKRFLRLIETSAARMDLLITDALNYSRTVCQELALTPVDAAALLRGMLASYPELQPSKSQIEIQGEIPLVMGNEAALTQCFSNLLGNAVKFVAPGVRPQIRIWAEVKVMSERISESVSEKAGAEPSLTHSLTDSLTDSRVRIWIEDNGIGIPESMLPRVFDMFVRGQNDYEGTGIGLALVRKAMDRMGGKVGVESQQGKGSRFWLELKPGES